MRYFRSQSFGGGLVFGFQHHFAARRRSIHLFILQILYVSTLVLNF